MKLAMQLKRRVGSKRPHKQTGWGAVRVEERESSEMTKGYPRRKKYHFFVLSILNNL